MVAVASRERLVNPRSSLAAGRPETPCGNCSPRSTVFSKPDVTEDAEAHWSNFLARVKVGFRPRSASARSWSFIGLLISGRAAEELPRASASRLAAYLGNRPRLTPRRLPTAPIPMPATTKNEPGCWAAILGENPDAASEDVFSSSSTPNQRFWLPSTEWMVCVSRRRVVDGRSRRGRGGGRRFEGDSS